MDGEKTRTTVCIFGEEYNLKGRGNSEYIQELARYVDKFMTEIKSHNPKLATYQVAVLAAVNIADLYFSSKWEGRESCQKEESDQEGRGEG